MVVDLGSSAGIDVFLAANIVKNIGKVIVIYTTYNILDKSKQNTEKHVYRIVEFRKQCDDEQITSLSIKATKE